MPTPCHPPLLALSPPQHLQCPLGTWDALSTVMPSVLVMPLVPGMPSSPAVPQYWWCRRHPQLLQPPQCPGTCNVLSASGHDGSVLEGESFASSAFPSCVLTRKVSRNNNNKRSEKRRLKKIICWKLGLRLSITTFDPILQGVILSPILQGVFLSPTDQPFQKCLRRLGSEGFVLWAHVAGEECWVLRANSHASSGLNIFP